MAISPDWRWKICYSTTRDQDRGRAKNYDGSLHYWKAKDWLLVMNAKGAPLVGRALKEGEKISIGSEPLVQPEKDSSGYVTVTEPGIQYIPVHPLPLDVPSTSVQQSDISVTMEQETVLDQPPTSDLNLVTEAIVGLGSSSGPDLSTDGLQEFEAMIDDMVYRVWECGRCLSMGHKASECINEIRCKACFSYGHIAKKCLTTKRKKSQVWVPKTASAVTGLLDSRDNPSLSSSVASPRQSPQGSTQSSAPSTSSSTPPISPGGAASPAMAVFELDPTPWLPLGHEIIDGGPTRLPRTFYTPPEMPQRRHDNLCIAYIAPP
ncbi:hypothetical protein ACQ4PT_052960 [Festuca glaucescens]